MRVLWFKDLPSHASIEVVGPNSNSGEESEDSDIVLRITRPNLTGCPAPAAILADWVKPGWQDVNATADFHPTRNVPENDGRARIVRFEEAPQRPNSV